MSTSGGAWKALERGAGIGCEIVQIFVKNNMQWFGRAASPADLELYARTLESTKLRLVFGHTGYLIEYGAVEQLAQTLLHLQRHPEHARQLGRQGLAKLRSQYLFGHMRDRWFELLDRRFGEPVSTAAQPAA